MGIENFTMDHFSLQGKNAVVTGGNTGLGLAFATALAKAGANIFVPSLISDDDQARDVVDCEPHEEITKYHLPIKKIIVEETIRLGGSMCHHHGVGKHRTHWIEDEYGSSYYILKKLKESYDPKGIMNKGTIIPMDS